MTDPVEEFAEGLETAATEQTSQQTLPTTDPVMAALRERFAGLDESMTVDSFTDYVLEIQQKSEKAEQLERQMAEFQAQQVAAQVLGKKEPVVESPLANPAETQARKRRWEPVSVENEALSFVNPDPGGYGYVPKNATNPLHIAAAQRANEQAAYQRQFINQLFSDPYSTVDELSREALEAMDAKWQKRFDEMQTSFKPIQDQMSFAEQQRQLEEWGANNSGKLWDAATKEMTPIGKAVDQLLRTTELPPAKALEIAEGLFPPSAPASTAPAKKPSLSKVAPKRVVDTIFDRVTKEGQPPSSRTSFVGSGKKKPSWGDLDQKLSEQYGSN